MQLSIVIPVLNDAAALTLLLADLAPALGNGDIEVVVVDGGSEDALVAAVANQPVRLIRSGRGRGLQQAAGVEATCGSIVWLLHADTRVPTEAVGLVLAQQSGWGRFCLRFEPDFPGMQVVAAMMHWRSRLTGICTGDQGIWIARDLLERIGGMPVQPLMEDIEMSARLRRVSWPAVLPGVLTTSSRRWRENGLVRTILQMWWFRWNYFLGTPAEELARSYGEVRTNPVVPAAPMEKKPVSQLPGSVVPSNVHGRSRKP